MNLIPGKIMWGVVLSGVLVSALSFSSCKVPQATQTYPITATYPAQSTTDSVQYRRIRADSLFIAAENRKMQGDFAEAATLFHDILTADPKNAAAAYELAMLNGRSKNAEGTLLYARKAAMLDTTNHWYQIAFANALAMNNEYDSAAGLFHRLSVRYPREESYTYNEAVMLSNAERYPEALQLFKLLEKEAGINEEFVYQKQRIYLKMKEPDSAAAEIQKLIDLYPDNSRYYGLLAQVYADNNQPHLAMGVYKTLLQKYPNNPQAMVALGVYYKNQGNDSAYRHYMTQAFANPQFDLEDKIAFVYPYLKYIEVDSTKKEEALFLCRLIVQAHPNEAAAHTIYGEMYFQSRQMDQAEQQFRTAIALDSTQYEPWNQLLLLYATQGNNEALRSTGRLATQRFPEEGGGWYFYGMANFFSGRYDSTVVMLRRALSTGVKDKELKSRMYATLGEAYNGLKNYPMSDSCFSFSLKLNPKDVYTLNNFSYLLAERGDYLEEALKMIQTAVSLQPNTDVFEDTYAWVLYRLGRYAEAKEWMEKALQHSGGTGHPGYLEHYGDILYKNHEIEKAVQYWQKAKEQGGDAAVLNWKIKHQRIPRKALKR